MKSNYLNDRIKVTAIYEAGHTNGLVYHNDKHINYMLKNCQKYFGHLLIDAPYYEDVLRTAILYHDIVYFPGGSDNEERSIALFRALNNGEEDFKKDVICLIMATKTHKISDMNTQGIHKLDTRIFELSKMISDLDLLSLATNTMSLRPEEDFSESTSSLVIQEAKNFGFTDAQIAEGRLKFLTEYLGRPNLYHTAPFSQFEEKAKSNMAIALYEIQTQAIFDRGAQKDITDQQIKEQILKDKEHNARK